MKTQSSFAYNFKSYILFSEWLSWDQTDLHNLRTSREPIPCSLANDTASYHTGANNALTVTDT